MQIDHLDNQRECKHEGCHCSVPEGQEFCSERCRSAEAKGAASTHSRGSCGCDHAECSAANEPLPAG